MWKDHDVTTRLATFLICATCGNLCDIIKQERAEFEPDFGVFLGQEYRIITRCRLCGRVETIQ